MSTVSLKTIKYESIKSIFASIADSDKISRAEISEKTGLSLVTVGKIADALLETNIICQVKEIKSQAGRRAGVLSVNESKFALILDLTAYDFKFAVLDLRMRQLNKNIHTYKTGLSFSENLNLFLGETASYINRKYRINDCIGIGIAVPGIYDSKSDVALSSKIPELGSVRLNAAVSNYFSDVPIIIGSHTNAAAKYNIEHVSDYKDKSILYWYVSANYVSGAYAVDGQLICGKNAHVCDLGSILVHEDLTLEDKISLSKNQEDCAIAIAPTMFNVLKILNPHTVIMEFETNYSSDKIMPIIKDTLTKKYRMKQDDLPEFIKAFSGFSSSHRGLALNLREIWLDRIVFS